MVNSNRRRVHPKPADPVIEKKAESIATELVSQGFIEPCNFRVQGEDVCPEDHRNYGMNHSLFDSCGKLILPPERGIEQTLPTNWRYKYFAGQNTLWYCAIIAFCIGVVTLGSILLIYNAGWALDKVGGKTKTPDVKPSTISASVTGYPNRAIVTAALPLYGLFRGIQIIGEFWGCIHKVDIPLSQTGDIPYSYALLLKETPHGQSILRSPLQVRLDNYITWFQGRNWVKPRHFIAMGLDATAQYFLILLLAVTSTEAQAQHEGFTVAFVVLYVLFGIADYVVHKDVAASKRPILFARLGLWVPMIAVAIAFVVSYTRERQDLVAVFEYILAVLILVHGLLGGLYLRNIQMSFVYQPTVTATSCYNGDRRFAEPDAIIKEVGGTEDVAVLRQEPSAPPQYFPMPPNNPQVWRGVRPASVMPQEQTRGRAPMQQQQRRPRQSSMSPDPRIFDGLDNSPKQVTHPYAQTANSPNNATEMTPLLKKGSPLSDVKFDANLFKKALASGR